MTELLTRETVVQACGRTQDLYPHLKNIQLILDTDDALRQQLAELQEWQRIIIGTGTDQEAVIRLAAMEYTKIAVQCWKDKVTSLEQQLATATYRLNVLKAERNALRAENSLMAAHQGLDNYQRMIDQIADLTAKLAKVMEENADMKAQLTQESQGGRQC